LSVTETKDTVNKNTKCRSKCCLRIINKSRSYFESTDIV